jgi:hypothetical protein
MGLLRNPYIAYAARRRKFRAIVLAAGALVACGAAPHAPQRTPGEPARVVWRYEVRVSEGLDLDVEADLGAAAGPLRVDEDAQPFVDVRQRSGPVRYHVRLADAARALADVDVAYSAGGAVFAPPSAWLLRPADVPDGGELRFHVTTAPGVAFATGVRPATGGPPGTYGADVRALENSSFAAFGALQTERLPGTEVDVVSTTGLRVPRASIVKWLSAETSAVADYFGAPERAVLFVAPGAGEVTRGKTLGDGGASVLLRLGTRVTEANLLDDWVAAHELVHVRFPALDPDHAWFAEGLATYIEPIARARAGLLTADRVWADLVENAPKGLPRAGDGGLDGTRETDRVYWGGAIYFLLADVALRERTNGRRSLDDALRAIVATGASVETHWPLARVLEEGDRATGSSVLGDLYRDVAGKAYAPDLEGLWRKLGVRRDASTVRFDATAPLAPLRAAITQPTGTTGAR